jgi:translation initiation factor IF-2
VDELRQCWEHAANGVRRARAVVDLRDVTFIDENGEKLLSEMRSRGAVFIAAGVETKHLLKHLQAKSERPLRRYIATSKHEGTKNEGNR